MGRLLAVPRPRPPAVPPPPLSRMLPTSRPYARVLPRLVLPRVVGPHVPRPHLRPRVVLPLAVLLPLVLLSGCATGPGAAPVGQSPTTPTAVPWIDTPVAPSVTPAPVPTARACTAADLPATATHGTTGGISQTQSAVVGLRNIGPSRCTLSGRPGLLATDAGGVLRAVPTEEANVGTSTPATLEPGATATALLVFSQRAAAARPRRRARTAASSWSSPASGSRFRG